MKEVYHLYKISSTQRNMKELAGERFTFFGTQGGYLYKNGACPVLGYRELGEEESRKELGMEETAWLYECNVALLAEETLRRSKEITEDIEKRLDEWETILKQGKEEGGNDREPDRTKHTDE